MPARSDTNICVSIPSNRECERLYLCIGGLVLARLRLIARIRLKARSTWNCHSERNCHENIRCHLPVVPDRNTCVGGGFERRLLQKRGRYRSWTDLHPIWQRAFSGAYCHSRMVGAERLGQRASLETGGRRLCCSRSRSIPRKGGIECGRSARTHAWCSRRPF